MRGVKNLLAKLDIRIIQHDAKLVHEANKQPTEEIQKMITSENFSPPFNKNK